jgi:hypothetical protein
LHGGIGRRFKDIHAQYRGQSLASLHPNRLPNPRPTSTGLHPSINLATLQSRVHQPHRLANIVKTVLQIESLASLHPNRLPNPRRTYPKGNLSQSSFFGRFACILSSHHEYLSNLTSCKS